MPEFFYKKILLNQFVGMKVKKSRNASCTMPPIAVVRIARMNLFFLHGRPGPDGGAPGGIGEHIPPRILFELPPPHRCRKGVPDRLTQAKGKKGRESDF